MQIYLTGANGYLGRWTRKLLEDRGHTVRTPEDQIPDYHLLRSDVVVHLGWHSRAGSDEPEKQIDSLERTKKLLAQLRFHQRIIFASSAAVYGRTGDAEMDERERGIDPVCVYGRAKLTAESYVVQRLPWRHLILRFGSLMGRGWGRDKTDVIVNAFASQGYSTGRIELWHPDSWKPVLHVQDAAEIIARAVQRPGWSGTYNAAEGCYRARELAGIASAITGAKVEIVEGQRGTRSCRLDCSALREEMPDMHFRTVEDAIREFAPQSIP